MTVRQSDLWASGMDAPVTAGVPSQAITPNLCILHAQVLRWAATQIALPMPAMLTMSEVDSNYIGRELEALRAFFIQSAVWWEQKGTVIYTNPRQAAGEKWAAVIDDEVTRRSIAE